MLTIVSLVASLTCDSPTCSSEASHTWRLRAISPVGVARRMPDVPQVNWRIKCKPFIVDYPVILPTFYIIPVSSQNCELPH